MEDGYFISHHSDGSDKETLIPPVRYDNSAHLHSPFFLFWLIPITGLGGL
jgi:hypothetical protein